MNRETPYFDQPSAFERLFTKLFGVLVGLGLPVPAGSLADAFRPFAARYPVLKLIPKS